MDLLKDTIFRFPYIFPSFGSLQSSSYGRYGGVLAPNGKIYFAPFTANFITVLDPLTHDLEEIQVNSGFSYFWCGGVLAPNGFIYFIPYRARKVLKFNYLDNSFSVLENTSNFFPWDGQAGGVLGFNNKIYSFPYSNNNRITEFDPLTDTAVFVGEEIPFFKSRAYYGCVNGLNGKIYGIPSDKKQPIYEFDPLSGSGSFVSGELSYGYESAITLPSGKILFVPGSGKEFLLFDPSAYSLEYFGYHNVSFAEYRGSVLGADGLVYLAPMGGKEVMRVDPENKTIALIGAVRYGVRKYQGGVLAPNGNIYLAPGEETRVSYIPTEKNFGLPLGFKIPEDLSTLKDSLFNKLFNSGK